MLFYYLAPLQNDSIIMHAVHFWGWERGLPVVWECPVTEKESMWEGKRSIGPRVKYGHANFHRSLAKQWKVEYAAPSVCMRAKWIKVCVSIFHFSGALSNKKA